MINQKQNLAYRKMLPSGQCCLICKNVRMSNYSPLYYCSVMELKRIRKDYVCNAFEISQNILKKVNNAL